MGKKIINEVRMSGVLPSQGADPIPVGKIPDDGTQVAARNAILDGTAIVHTVTAGKTLYLVNALFSSSNANAASQGTRFFVTNAEDAVQYYFYYVSQVTLTTIVAPYTFPTLLEIPTGYKIKITSGHADVYAHAFIFGYEM